MGYWTTGKYDTDIFPGARSRNYMAEPLLNSPEIKDSRLNEPSSNQSSDNEINLEDPFVGKILANRYKIESVLGSGGWGKVYLAEHLTLNTQVAVKVLHQQYARDDDRQKRLEQEAKIMSRVDSQFVIKTIDFGVTPVAFIVMEYFEAIPLCDLLQSESLTENTAITIFEEICEGLSAAHSLDLVHRDLKPSNVLVKKVDDSYHCKIMDFGIAKALDDTSNNNKLTATGEILGSPAYMSPEQWTARGLDARSDIYSLGCLMYEVLTGKLIFAATNGFEYLNFHLAGQADSFAIAAPERKISADLEKVVMKCLQKDPEDRYSTALDLREDLIRVKSGKQLNIKLKSLNNAHLAAKSLITSGEPSHGGGTLWFKGANNGTFKVKWPLLVIAMGLIISTGICISRKDDMLHYLCGDLVQQSTKLARESKFDQAVESLKSAWTFAQFLPAQDKTRLNILRSLSSILAKHGSFTESEKYKGILLNETGDVPPNKWLQLNYRMQSELQRRHYASAEQLAASALKIAEESGKTSKHGNHTLLYARSLDALYAVYRTEEGRTADALRMAQESWSIAEDLLAPDDPSIVSRLNNLGLAYSSKGMMQDAKAAYFRAIKIGLQMSPPAPAIVHAYNNLATTLIHSKNYEEALASAQKALEVNKLLNGDGETHIKNQIGAIYLKQKRYTDGIKVLNEALDSHRKEGTINNTKSNHAWFNLALNYLGNGQETEALNCFKKCMDNYGSGPRDKYYRIFEKRYEDLKKHQGTKDIKHDEIKEESDELNNEGVKEGVKEINDLKAQQIRNHD